MEQQIKSHFLNHIKMHWKHFFIIIILIPLWDLCLFADVVSKRHILNDVLGVVLWLGKFITTTLKTAQTLSYQQIWPVISCQVTYNTQRTQQLLRALPTRQVISFYALLALTTQITLQQHVFLYDTYVKYQPIPQEVSPSIHTKLSWCMCSKHHNNLWIRINVSSDRFHSRQKENMHKTCTEEKLHKSNAHTSNNSMNC
jgi:hypothetical protein